MKTFTNILLSGAVALSMSACAGKTYMGKVDVVGIGAGAKSATKNANTVNDAMLADIVVAYTPNLITKEQKVNETVKYVAGDALIKEYSGEPKLLADYLNAYQSLNNKILILDKNGVVAWSGFYKGNIKGSRGVYDYGITGADFMPFDEAMEKFVIDGDEADFDDEKVISFPKTNKDSLLSGFSYSKKYPLLFTKLPDMKVVTTSGKTVSTNRLAKDGKPTVLVLYMSKGKSDKNLASDIDKARNLVGMFTGDTVAKDAAPQKVLQDIQTSYFSK